MGDEVPSVIAEMCEIHECVIAEYITSGVFYNTPLVNTPLFSNVCICLTFVKCIADICVTYTSV